MPTFQFTLGRWRNRAAIRQQEFARSARVGITYAQDWDDTVRHETRIPPSEQAIKKGLVKSRLERNAEQVTEEMPAVETPPFRDIRHLPDVMLHGDPLPYNGPQSNGPEATGIELG